MNTLFTGFRGNASCRLLGRIESDYCRKLLLTNSFTGLKRDIDSITDNYDTVYMFGIDRRLRVGVRIEMCAVLDGETLYTSLDAETIRDALAANGIRARVSSKPTAYLCNSAYYHMLQKYGGRAMFIHIPATDDLIDNISAAFKQLI